MFIFQVPNYTHHTLFFPHSSQAPLYTLILLLKHPFQLEPLNNHPRHLDFPIQPHSAMQARKLTQTIKQSRSLRAHNPIPISCPRRHKSSLNPRCALVEIVYSLVRRGGDG